MNSRRRGANPRGRGASDSSSAVAIRPRLAFGRFIACRGSVNQDRAALVDALELFGRGRLDIVDCILIAKARHGRSEPFSFDDALMKEYRSIESSKGNKG